MKDVRNTLPQAVKACLWSYDTDKIDLSREDHKLIVIQNVLNRGTSEAVDWLLDIFSKEEIALAISKTNVSEWNKKSLSLWSLIFSTRPLKENRFI